MVCKGILMDLLLIQRLEGPANQIIARSTAPLVVNDFTEHL